MRSEGIERHNLLFGRYQWPRGQRRWPAAARSLGYELEFYRGYEYLFLVSVVYCEAEVSATDLITRSENTHRVWCV